MTSGLLRRGALCLALACGLASAQQFPFQLLVSNASNAITAANGSTLPFVALVGQSQSLQVRATYVGTGRVNITQSPQIFGSTAFSASVTGTLPITLTPGDVLAFSITYRPTSPALATASFGIPFVETISTTTPPTNVQNTILFGLQGAAPAFQLNYVLTADQNVLPLPDGGTITFPPTPINTTSTAFLLISNVGSGPGDIKAITTPPATSAFRVSGLLAFPITLNANSQLRLQVDYKPTGAVTDTGQIQVTLDSGTILTANLLGSGTAPSLVYELLQGDAPVAVTPPGPIALPDTNVGETSSVIVRVRNAGNGTATVNTPGTSGAAFSLSDLPLFPQILKTGDSFTFSINFTPPQAAALKGNLVVSSDLFSLTGQGLGAKLTFSYTTPAGTKVLASGDAVVFGQIPIGQNQQVSFTVANTGTLPAPIANIGVAESNSPFKVSGISRPLPTSLGAGESLQFTITFTPTIQGFVNGNLRVDAVSVPLTGSGDALPTLPAYTIQAPSGTVAPQTQAPVRLRLSSSFPVALVGTLSITPSAGNVGNDPAVQFSTGGLFGRSVTFVIPANSTDANFAGQGAQIFVQTGTVASTYVLSPTFQTQVGGVDVTPTAPATVQFTVPSLAPTLISIQATSETTNSFVLIVSGYSTSRSLTSLVAKFTAAPGFSLGSGQVSVDLRTVATAWFQSASSTAFGGQFSVAVPFTFAGTLPTGQTLLQSVSAVEATVSNEAGTSTSLRVSIP